MPFDGDAKQFEIDVPLSQWVLDALVQARALLDDPRRWTTAAFARTATGSHTYGGDKNAVSWCSVGAIQRVTHPIEPRALRERVRRQAIRTLGNDSYDSARERVININDSIANASNYRVVLSLFDGAINRAGRVTER